LILHVPAVISANVTLTGEFSSVAIPFKDRPLSLTKKFKQFLETLCLHQCAASKRRQGQCKHRQKFRLLPSGAGLRRHEVPSTSLRL
jgi:hypothetical protein